ncbi:hypothetical protein INR49_019614 [Caranx melampygus]|nr:hypothetical protein INR49_019614 [Caranx melampygus]
MHHSQRLSCALQDERVKQNTDLWVRQESWLFQLNLGEAKKLHELESDSWEYWKRLRKENIWRFNRLHKGKKF